MEVSEPVLSVLPVEVSEPEVSEPEVSEPEVSEPEVSLEVPEVKELSLQGELVIGQK